MARYKKGQEKLPEFTERALLALYSLTLECEKCLNGGGEIYLPGRSLSAILGGRWSDYRHKLMLQAQDLGWCKCELGYEKNSTKKIVWRYSLTEPAKVTMLDRFQRASRECIWYSDIQPALPMKEWMS